jgi:hypothetical protein
MRGLLLQIRYAVVLRMKLGTPFQYNLTCSRKFIYSLECWSLWSTAALNKQFLLDNVQQLLQKNHSG